MDFSECYERNIADIEKVSRRQFIYGLDRDDIMAEMVGCLWKAWKTWDSTKGEFLPYWWSLWLNRRSDLNLAAQRLKRPPTVLMGQYGDFLIPEPTKLLHVVPQPPKGCGARERWAWRMLAEGATPTDIMQVTGMSRRRYYAMIRSWRTTEVKDSLS